MKKYRTYFTVLIVLVVLTALLMMKNTGGTFRNKGNSFAVSDTTNVTKFFIADKNNNSVKVERSANGSWVLNDKYEVNPTMVQVMLTTFIGIEAKAPVAKGTRNTIIRLMAGKSNKVEIYQKGYRINIFNYIKLFPHEKLTRTYYVGDPTQDNNGTYMLMAGSEDPYVVNIPGFRGFVATRYSPMEADWRSHSVFKVRVPEIASLSVKYTQYPEKSFMITNRNNQSFTLTSLVDNRNIEKFDTLKVVEYLSLYRNLNYEAYLDEMTKSKQDSVLATTPSSEIILVDKLGKTRILKAWQRKAEKGQLDLDGNQLDWDRERMYGYIDKSDRLVSLQYFVFNDVFIPLQMFTSSADQQKKP